MAEATTNPDPMSGTVDKGQGARIGACRALLRRRMEEIDADAAAIFADWRPEIARDAFRCGASIHWSTR